MQQYTVLAISSTPVRFISTFTILQCSEERFAHREQMKGIQTVWILILLSVTIQGCTDSEKMSKGAQMQTFQSMLDFPQC